MEGVKHGSRDHCGLVRDPEMADGVEGVRKYDPLDNCISTNDLFRVFSVCKDYGLPYFPSSPGRRGRTSLPILGLLSRGSCRVRTSFRREEDQGLLAVP
jgi:hypothetical protein